MFSYIGLGVFLYVLCYRTVLVNGQCTISRCKDFASELDESLLGSFEEHEQEIKIMKKNLSSALGKLSADVNRSIVRGQEELKQNVKMAFLNLSSKIENIEGKFRLMNESVVNALKENDRKFQTILENISLSIIEKMNEKLNKALGHVNESLLYIKSQDSCGGNPALCDCSIIRANGNTTSGVYRIHVDHRNVRHYANAFCDMTTGNRGWTVFQKRKDGSEDFYRGWNDYANGFGNPNGEFWLGNDFLHMLTSQRRYRLRIDLEDFEGGKAFAEYSTFNISSAEDKYRLRVRNYSGNAGDSLSYHNNRQFSTKDQDNDLNKRNCSVRDRGAWWYRNCHESNLNGLYYRSGSYSCSGCYSGDGIEWFYWRNTNLYSLKSTEMKISAY